MDYICNYVSLLRLGYYHTIYISWVSITYFVPLENHKSINQNSKQKFFLFLFISYQHLINIEDMSSIATSIESFVPDLKKNPRLAYRKFRNRVLLETRTSCNEITENYGLLYFLLPLADWLALPGNSGTAPNGAVINIGGYDIDGIIEAPAADATSVTVKLYEISISDRKIVYRALAYLTQKFINSLAPDDISELSDEVYGMMNVTLRQCYVHSEGKYGRLDQSDFDKIFETLQSPKLATQDFAALADIHRDMHQLLASSNQVSTEYMKTQYFMQAIKDDPAGRYATELFLQQYPYIPDRRFTDLFATVIRHAPTYIATNVSLGYSSALSTVSIASASAAPLDAVALALQIAKTQKELAALLKQHRGTSTTVHPPSAPRSTTVSSLHQYCHKHGYQKTHAGNTCKFMQSNPTRYTAQHLSATDPLTPPGGNPTIRG